MNLVQQQYASLQVLLARETDLAKRKALIKRIRHTYKLFKLFEKEIIVHTRTIGNYK